MLVLNAVIVTRACLIADDWVKKNERDRFYFISYAEACTCFERD